MHLLSWEYRLGRGCALIAQRDDSLAVWCRRARQTSQSWPATAEDHGGCLDHSERAHRLFITGAHLVVRKNLLYITEARIWPASWRYVLHAPETCAPILDTRQIPSRKDSAMRSLIKHYGGWGLERLSGGLERLSGGLERLSGGLERLSGGLERLGGNSVQNMWLPVEISRRTPHFHVTFIKCVIKIQLAWL
jgi:X-X-X-Leu-X-X-Gly heptad repeat protein